MHKMTTISGSPLLREILRRVLRAKNQTRRVLRVVYARLLGDEHFLFRITRPESNEISRCSMLVAGSETIADAYNSFFFERAGRIEKLRRISGLALARSAAEAATADDDLIVWEAWPWQRKSTKDYLALEAWSDAVLTLEAGDFSAFIRASVSSMIERRIKKYNQSPCEIELSDRDEDLEFFYYNLYTPLLDRRHGQNAHSTSLATQKSFGGYTVAKFVMFLRKDGERIAGMLLLNDLLSSRLTIQDYGVAAPFLDDQKYFQELYAAMNYSAIEWAHRNGLKDVSFGGAQNNLRSGVYFYKKQWGVRFLRNREREAVCIRFVSPRKVQLLAEFPLIFFEAGEPCGLTGWLPKGEDLGASTDELVKNVNAFACKNMKGIKVVLPDESLHVASALSPQTLAKSRVSLSFGG